MFYFAWVSDGDTAFGVGHEVEDEQIVSFVIEHEENQFASLKIVVVNPEEGLLASGRDQWAWLSWRKPDDTVVPLFHGRIVGVPEDLQNRLISMEFLARPADFEMQKAALA